jgi:hypothetical protein
MWASKHLCSRNPWLPSHMRETVTSGHLETFAARLDTDDGNAIDHRYPGVLDYASVTPASLQA